MRRLTARHKAHQVKPLELSELVPGKDRTNWRHSIYWKGIARNGTEAVHDCLELVDNTSACLRRWNDFTINGRPIIYSTRCTLRLVCRDTRDTIGSYKKKAGLLPLL